MTPDLPLVSVLIVTWNRCHDLLDTLEALGGLDYPRERLEVLLLDNGSADQTEATVRRWMTAAGPTAFARAECFRSALNRGACWGRNFLAAHVSPTSAYFLTLDDDAVPEAGVIHGLLRSARARPAVGIVGAKIVAAGDPGRVLAGAGFVSWRTGRFVDRFPPTTTVCDYVISCAALVRRDAFVAAAGYDDAYFVYHEDVDFCVRLARRGWRVVYEPSVVVQHKVPPGKSRSSDRLYYVLRNKLLFLRRHRPLSHDLLPQLAFWAVVIPRAIAGSLRTHRGVDRRELGAILAAARDGWRGRTGAWNP